MDTGWGPAEDGDPARVPGIAFFDVDETLLTVKSMFRFLEHHVAARGLPPGAYHAAAERLRAQAAGPRSREHGNRAYYRLFAGRSAAELSAHGRDWFAAELATGRLFHEPVLEALQEHRQRGDTVVLVSGSFPACLDPVAEHVGATEVLCSRPEVVDGRHTGGIAVPMIGPAKAVAARRLMAERDVDRRDAYAYGDHLSDLPLLLAVGNPVVVGDDGDLVALAVASGWRRIPVTLRPAAPAVPA